MYLEPKGFEISIPYKQLAIYLELKGLEISIPYIRLAIYLELKTLEISKPYRQLAIYISSAEGSWNSNTIQLVELKGFEIRIL